MSKLRDIIEAKMVAIEPTEVFSAPDEVIQQIKDLMLELVGEDWQHTGDPETKLPDWHAGRNEEKASLRRAINNL